MDEHFDKIAINVRSHKLLKQLLKENPRLETILQESTNETEALVGVRAWALEMLQNSPAGLKFYTGEATGHQAFIHLSWQDYATIRILDYIDNAGREFRDLNLRGAAAISNPIKQLWLAYTNGTGGAKPFFFEDMLHLFRQFSGKALRAVPAKNTLEQWMTRYPSGLDPEIIRLRVHNRDRILKTLIAKIENGQLQSAKFAFTPDMSEEQKFLQALKWWDGSKFHLRMAIRSPDLLNEILNFSLDPDTMNILYEAERAGIPFFVNPYYLSLLHVSGPSFAIEADLAIRDYIVYSKELVQEFGQIVAWEKEDTVEPGKPNAAGWLLPSSHNIHRRYPDVAIFIPDTGGRACGGLCSVCQRMYDYQRKVFNFDFDTLKPNGTWRERLPKLMAYFEHDSQLRDILISGGDALMSSNTSLHTILDAVYTMALNKRRANAQRKDGMKYAELVRVRLGTRLPVYLPQRITPELTGILAEFKQNASQIGVKQFIIQTHFVSPMEVTPESRDAVQRLLEAGWLVTNQLVFTAAASRRGHSARLRQVLNDIGVLPYYTFIVKGYRENFHNFAPIARCVQEEIEEKVTGKIPASQAATVSAFHQCPENLPEKILDFRKTAELPFLATDRSVMNLPGVGKSLTFRMIGITRYGRRILEFEHDSTRQHSPIIKNMKKVVIIEPKSISEYLRQLEDLGEDAEEYGSLFGYSMGETEPRFPIYEYPEYDYQVTDTFTNLDLGS
jgi:lysine 2,3-aminomutase